MWLELLTVWRLGPKREHYRRSAIRVSVPQEVGAHGKAFCDLALEILQCHFLCILLFYKSVTKANPGPRHET